MVIDLDQPAEDRPAARHPPWRRWRWPITATALLTVGGVAGALATFRWESHRAERTAGSTVAVVAVPGAFGWAGQASTSYPSVGEPRTVVTMTGRLSVVNAGPRRVRLRELIFDQPGTTLYGNDVERWIGPLEASTVEVVAEMQCRGGAHRDARLTLTVETTAATVERSSVPWDGKPWDGERQRACALNEAG